jgi:hypothetical protein
METTTTPTTTTTTTLYTLVKRQKNRPDQDVAFFSAKAGAYHAMRRLNATVTYRADEPISFYVRANDTLLEQERKRPCKRPSTM